MMRVEILVAANDGLMNKTCITAALEEAAKEMGLV